MRRSSVRCALLFVLVGCADNPASDPCLTKKVTVEAGVFGLVFQQCGDIGGTCPGVPYAGAPVVIYPATSPGNPPTGEALERTQSDDAGFYQLVGTGPVDLCVGVNPQCINALSLSGAPARWDYVDFDGLGSKWQKLSCTE